MSEIVITTDGTRVVLTASCAAELPAKVIGGRFRLSAKAWSFDARDEERVRDLTRSIYGTDGSKATCRP